jgi:DegV family protein with EDD domain
MKDFIIITDSTCDLGKEMRRSHGIEYLKMPVTYKDKQSYCSLEWEYFSEKQFYDDLRAGILYRTSQITIEMYIEAFEKAAADGKDILSVSCSSALSGSINSSVVARATVLEKYPEAKIFCLDALIASLGQGLICCRAADMRKDGKTIEEVAAWIEENKLCFQQSASVADLSYLKRAGRVTVAAAAMGKIFSIKPIIISDSKGQNLSIAKVRGRQKSFRECVNYVSENIVDPGEQVIFISHADCEQDALSLKQLLLEKFTCKDVYINSVGPALGASVGPGMFGIYFYGKKVTV